MKKTLLLFCLIGIICSANAQTVKFGIKAGVNFSSETASYSGASMASDSHTGFHFGAVADIPLGDFSIQPGLLYSGKGITNATFSYIEVPVNLLYHIKAGVGKVFIGAGPYLAYGISVSNGLSFGSTNDKVANPDYGLGGLAGYRFDTGFFFSASRELGLANLVNNGNGIADKNRVTSISIGYFF